MAIAREGFILIGVATTLALVVFVIAAIIGSWILWLAAYAFVLLALLLAVMFRDPERRVEPREDAVLAAADGRVIAVEEVDEPGFLGGPAIRVATALGLLDVHIQRAPVAGRVEYFRFWSARPRRVGLGAAAPGAAAENAPASAEHDTAASAEPQPAVPRPLFEWSAIGIGDGRVRVLVHQLAERAGHRVHSYVQEGQQLRQGERIGMIRFGYRVDTYLPLGTRVAIREGDRVRAGRTVLGQLPASSS